MFVPSAGIKRQEDGKIVVNQAEAQKPASKFSSMARTHDQNAPQIMTPPVPVEQEEEVPKPVIEAPIEKKPAAKLGGIKAPTAPSGNLKQIAAKDPATAVPIKKSIG